MKLNEDVRNLLIAMSVGLVLGIAMVCLPAFHHDLDCFKTWGSNILDMGTGNFYEYGYDRPTDYPPIYMLICALMAAICRALNANAFWQDFLFRLPTVFIFVANIYLFYQIARHFKMSSKKSSILTLVFAIAPAIMIDIKWGQVDCFTMFFVMISTLMFLKQKYFASMICCTLGLLTKIQFIFILPVLGVAILYRYIKEKKIGRFFLNLLICLLIYFIVYLPFIYKQLGQGDIFYIFRVLIDQITHYQTYATNAFNLYTGLGLNGDIYPNWYYIINFIIIFVFVALSVFLVIKNPSDKNVVLLSSYLVTAIFMMSTSMHERYMLAVIGIMLIISHVINSKKLLIINYFFYFVQFINTYFAWYLYIGNGFNHNWVAILLSLLSVVMFALFTYEVIRYTFGKKKDKDKTEESSSVNTISIDTLENKVEGRSN